MPSEKDSQIALGRLYATALMDLAEAQGRDKVAAVREDLDSIRATIDAEDRFRAFLNSARIDLDARKRTLRDIFEGRVERETLHLMMVMADHDRLSSLDEVCDQFALMRDAQLNRAHVEVVSAVALDDAERQQLLNKLRAVLGKEPVLHEKIDDDLIAGLIVQIADRRMDATGKRMLSELRESMAASATRAVVSGRLVSA